MVHHPHHPLVPQPQPPSAAYATYHAYPSKDSKLEVKAAGYPQRQNSLEHAPASSPPQPHGRGDTQVPPSYISVFRCTPPEVKQSTRVPKQACNQCRQSKVKCDGTEPCGTCKRRKFECSYQDPVVAREKDERALADVLRHVILMHNDIMNCLLRIEGSIQKPPEVRQNLASGEDNMSTVHRSPLPEKMRGSHYSNFDRQLDHIATTGGNTMPMAAEEHAIEQNRDPLVKPGESAIPMHRTVAGAFLSNRDYIQHRTDPINRIGHSSEFPVNPEQIRDSLMFYNHSGTQGPDYGQLDVSQLQVAGGSSDTASASPAPVFGHACSLSPAEQFERRGRALAIYDNPESQVWPKWTNVVRHGVGYSG